MRAKPFMIFGVDEAQACELAICFIRKHLRNTAVKIIDGDGAEIGIPDNAYPAP